MNTKTSLRARALPLAALALAVPLALSACGSDEPADAGRSTAPNEAPQSSNSQVFDFSDSPEQVTGEKITLELPDGVGEAMPAYQKGKILESVVLRPVDTGSSYCAISYEFHYAKGGLQRARSMEADQGNDSTSEYESVASSLYYSTVPQDTDITPDGGTSQLSVDATRASGELADDYRTALSLVECADGIADDGDTATVSFPYRTPNGDKMAAGTTVLASAEVAVQQDGTLSVVSSKMEGLRISSDGSVFETDE